MPFRCKFCDGRFCSDHRLPENHDCGGLRDYKDKSREEGKIGYNVMNEEKTVDVQDPGGSWREQIQEVMPDHATDLVLATILIVFLLQVTVPGFMETFALFPDTVFERPWTLFTSIFLHGGLLHLMINAIVLWSFGRHLERIIGTKRFLEVLVVSGVASSAGFAATATLFDIGPAVGISGGIYGLVAVLAAIRPRLRVLAFFIVPLKIRHAVILFAALDAANLVATATGAPLLPLASAGHLSGLLAGLYYGYRWKERFRERRNISVWDML